MKMPRLSMKNTPKYNTKSVKINVKRLSIARFFLEGAFAFLDLMLLAGLGVIFYLNIYIKTQSDLYIPKGSIKSIISHINSLNIDANIADNMLLRLAKTGGKNIQSGFINSSKFGELYVKKGDFLHSILTSKATLKKIILKPGESLHFFIKRLSSELNLSELDLQKSYIKYASILTQETQEKGPNKLGELADGLILPQTYFLPLGSNSDFIMAFLLKNSIKILNDLQVKKDTLIIASIIEKEAANISEMPLISSVIYNRLKKQMPLQMDGALNYGEFAHQKVTPKRIRSDNSSFNTYKFQGLPKNPIGSVSLEAIKAALNPANTSFLFFVLDRKNKKHIFAKTYKEHLKNIAANR
ncbi:MAG: endolytic transglycosylase MltG [Helicobacter sp.]|nr:endolytic transglycosylase MltG [Helicobacter sp.]